MITFGSLFAGIGGFDLGFERAGMVCKWQVENDLFRQKRLNNHWPNVRRYGDVKGCGKHNLETVDLICGGFPCQDVSLAGKRGGLARRRSGLWFEFSRIIREIRPRWIVVENVPGLYSIDNGGGFGAVLWDLAESGYDAEWDMLPASAFGAPHLRYRVFILAYSVGRHIENGTVIGRQFDPSWRQTSLGEFGRMGSAEDWAKAVTDYARRDDGISCRVDRMMALKDAVVPQVAEWIGRRILEVEAQP